MLDKFWEAAGEKLADRWVSVSTSALIFWLGGLLTWMWSHGGFSALRKVADWADKQSALTQLVALLAALISIAASGVIIQRFASPALRLIEGYWPAPLDRIRRRRTGTIRAKAKHMEDRFQKLADPVLDTKTATTEQRSEFVNLDQKLRRLPADGDYLPTRTGNILRAGERRPKEKYGLDAVVLWPRLWLLLPADTRTELSQARASLDTAVGAVIWALLFLGFTFLAWWAVPIAIGIILVMILYWIPDRAEVFADLLEAAFDVHRVTIYEHLRWPLPANPHQEHVCGEQLTSYLLRGGDSTTPVFTSPGPPEEASATSGRPPASGAAPTTRTRSSATRSDTPSHHEEVSNP